MQTHRTTLTALLIVAACLPAVGHAQSATATAALPDTLAAATADRSASGCPPMRLSSLQRRVLTEADRGSEGLGRYLNRTRMIHQLDYTETATWVEQVRQRNLDCRTVITASAP